MLKKCGKLNGFAKNHKFKGILFIFHTTNDMVTFLVDFTLNSH
jgi:hypothetical protein